MRCVEPLLTYRLWPLFVPIAFNTFYDECGICSTQPILRFLSIKTEQTFQFYFSPKKSRRNLGIIGSDLFVSFEFRHCGAIVLRQCIVMFPTLKSLSKLIFTRSFFVHYEAQCIPPAWMRRVHRHFYCTFELGSDLLVHLLAVCAHDAPLSWSSASRL